MSVSPGERANDAGLAQDCDPSPWDLAMCEADLPEWDQLRIQDYWDALITEELGAPLVSDELETPQLAVSRDEWSALGSGERARLRRLQRRSDNTALRTVTAAADAVPAPNLGEVA